MRWLLAAPEDGFTEKYIRTTLETMGHEVTSWDFRERFHHHHVEKNRPNAPERVTNEFIDHTREVDHALALKGKALPKPAFRGAQAPVTLWNFDPRNHRENWLDKRARLADVYLTIAEGLVDYWRDRRGATAYWLPEAGHPDYHYPVDVPQAEQVPVGFIGTVQDVEGRTKWLQAVAEEHELHLWGSYPGELQHHDNVVYHGRAEGDEGFREANARCRVVLGRDRDPQLARSYGARLYRTLMCEAFLLTNHTTGALPDWGDVCGVYDGTRDCVGQLRYWVQNPKERRERAQQARERVLAHHTWEHRLERLVNILAKEDLP